MTGRALVAKQAETVGPDQHTCERDFLSGSEANELTDIIAVRCDPLLGQIGRPDEDLEPERACDGDECLAESTKAKDAERLAPEMQGAESDSVGCV